MTTSLFSICVREKGKSTVKCHSTCNSFHIVKWVLRRVGYTETAATKLFRIFVSIRKLISHLQA